MTLNAASGLILPWTPLGSWFGLVHLPFSFYLFLIAAGPAIWHWSRS